MSLASRRREAVERLESRSVDVLVVGGGIIGTGVARDLALRGYSVALVEQNDLASGTSSKPTRLIHGGLRYLELFDFRLVRDDMREREILLRIAPHLVFPLPFLMPFYDTSLGYQAKLRAGMQLYDLLSFDKSLPTRRWLSRDEVLRQEPAVKAEGLQGAWRYYDAQVPLVERLVLENALDAAAEGNLTLLNHARVQRFVRQADATVPGGRVTGAIVRDVLADREFEVRATLTVNASGPWLDMTDAEIRPGRPPLLRLTKGVHLVTPSATTNAQVLFAQTDDRLFFIVPWLGFSLIGTTDTDYQGDPAEAGTSEEDARYLIENARQAFPSAPLDQIYYTYAGVRALVRVDGVKEGQVSRKHAVLDHEAREGVAGIVSVVGGKITAYRGIAEEVSDLAARKLGRRVLGYSDRRQLPGGHLGDPIHFVARELWPRAESLGLSRPQAENLGEVYGSLAHEVLDMVEEDRVLAEPVHPSHPTILAQVVRATEKEWAVSLADILLRRTSLGFMPTQGVDALDTVTARVGRALGWDAATQQAEAEAYRREIALMRERSTLFPIRPGVPSLAST